MREKFVDLNLAKKLKEKGFTCKYPFAMYSEDGYFYPLFTSCDEDKDVKCIFGNRLYYVYDDFIDDEDAIIAPTISQALKWLREEKNIFVEIALSPEGYRHIIYTGVYCTNTSSVSHFSFDGFYNNEDNYMTYEQAAFAGIEYILNNLI